VDKDIRKDSAPPAPDPDPAKLGMDGLLKINQFIQSQLAKQASKADIKLKSSEFGKQKAYVAGNHALGAVPIQPSLPKSVPLNALAQLSAEATNPRTSAAVTLGSNESIIRPSRSGGGISSYVKIQDPLRAQEGCLEYSGSIPNRCK
jgi:hypothetical protein